MSRFPVVFLASRRPIAALLIPLMIAGCYRWRVTETAPRTLVATERPSLVRVTTPHGTIELRAPHVVGDSLLGAGQRQRHQTIRIALADVTRIETSHLDGLRTGLLVGGILAAMAAFVYANLATDLGS